jgi:hypothetical protein
VCAARDPKLTEKRIAVIGAGAAGVTAASALRAIGVPAEQVVIYEMAASPLYAQRASYSRFLHPRLFHWPEAGWEDGTAALPVADWEAGYAAAVRDRILSHCADLAIEFCTCVHDVGVKDGAVRVDYRRLHTRAIDHATFDLGLVATGFPPEPRVEHTIGGSYWHAGDGLDDLRGEVHVVGDGDGALTEVLMMLIDRFGHGAVEQLCERLPLEHIELLNAADLQAQGDPSKAANPSREAIESLAVRIIFALLADGRAVSIHATDPLSGRSFLLNRTLVSHLTWDPRPMVKLAKGAKIDPAGVTALRGSVIWRTGVGSVAIPEFAEARMTPRRLIAEHEPTGAQESFDLGVLGSLLDGLRRPAWTASAEARMGSSSGWVNPEVGSLHAADGRPTSSAERLLRVLAATKSELELLGLHDLDVLARHGSTWVSIDVLARTGSCPHQTLVEPMSWAEKLQAQLREVKAGVTVSRASMSHDEWQRLWFTLPHDSQPDGPTRAAVCALVDPSEVAGWARDLGSRLGARNARPAGERVSASVLRGLSDVAGPNVQAQLLLASMHERRGEWDWARRAYLRAARRPGGRRLSAGERPRSGSPPMNETLRRVLLRLAGAATRLRPGDRAAAVDHAVWLLLCAAAADLVTVTDSAELILELRATPAFLVREWAPRVRRVRAFPGRRARRIARGEVPEWAEAVARAGARLAPPPRGQDAPGDVRSKMPDDDLHEIREIATGAVRQGYEATPNDALITLSEFGVWPAGTELDWELQSSLST